MRRLSLGRCIHTGNEVDRGGADGESPMEDFADGAAAY